MNIFKIIKYQLYLFQLENYEFGRFWKLLFKKGLLPIEGQRQQLVWTVKAGIFYSFSALLILFCSSLVIWLVNGGQIKFWYLVLPAFVLLVYLFSLFSFVFLSLAEFILLPADFTARQCVIFWAEEKLKKLEKVKIIAIAGSFGKTTLKQILLKVLGEKFNVEATPSSINTPIGIARWIIKKVDLSTEILIVEMGEHYVGDVEYLCKITTPDIAVVTGINEAHLERMKTIENVESTIFEVVSFSKPGALIVLNEDDMRVVKNYKKYVWPDHKLAFYGQRNNESRILNYEFNTQRLGWEVGYEGFGQVFINLLGGYAIGDVDAAIKIAKSLGMKDEDIKRGIFRIEPIEHRLQPIKSPGDVLVIDDSYNGNPSGASEAIKLLAKFENRRKIYITPGLVEIGKQTKTVHMEMGKRLAKTADLVILIKNSVTPFIEMGLLASGFSQEKILWFNKVQEAHASLGKILKPGDVILFQNDWGDQYI